MGMLEIILIFVIIHFLCQLEINSKLDRLRSDISDLESEIRDLNCYKNTEEDDDYDICDDEDDDD